VHDVGKKPTIIGKSTLITDIYINQTESMDGQDYQCQVTYKDHATDIRPQV